MNKKNDWKILILLASCAFASVIAYHQVFNADWRKENSSETMTTVAFNPPKLQPVPLLKKEKNYVAIDRKPIFFESRKPKKAPIKAKAKLVQIRKPKLEVIGILTNDDRKLALLKLDKKGKVGAYSSGDTVLGWSIVSIEDNHITLEFRGSSEQYTIKDYPTLSVDKPGNIIDGLSGQNRLIEIK